MARAGHDSRAIANHFIRLAKQAGKRMSITQLVKLVYFAHGWNLGLYNRPLSAHPVEAWRYGPVMCPVYDAFRPQGSNIRREYPIPAAHKFSDEEKGVMDRVYEVFSDFSPFELSEMTHFPDSPWDWARKNGKFYKVIPDEIVRGYFQGLIQERKHDGEHER
jgi:uncharacterized phage-associated protein